MKKFIPIIFIFFIVILFFKDFFIYRKLPIPADTIVGLYNPYRDLYFNKYPRGLPFKNFIITDPVRQIYVWKNLAIDYEKKLEIPLWNPYQMAGYPLLANFQSSPFYFLNIFLFIKPFYYGWSLMIFLQIFLSGFFMLIFLKNKKLNNNSSLIGSLIFMFGGFSTSWLEWNTVIQTGLWLPLILLSIDKLFFFLKIKNKKLILLWSLIFIFSLQSAFFAGHLQIFFYLSLISFFYILWNLVNFKNYKFISIFIVLFLIFLSLTSFQLFPTLQFILLSARSSDQSYLNNTGWFLPLQNLIQLLIPDFFGNPATLNYWGIWNYGEFVSFIGVAGFIFALNGIFNKNDREGFFWKITLLISLIFVISNPISKIPFEINIPFFSTAQPTRLIFLIDFSLAILASFGFESYSKNKKKILLSLFLTFLIFIISFTFSFWIKLLKLNINSENIRISIHNMILPFILFIITFSLILFEILFEKYKNKKNNLSGIIKILFIIILTFDLLRFSLKYNTFSDKSYIFPKDPLISFIQKNVGFQRIMSLNPQIFPPNFSTIYKLQNIDGYDPLYLKNYAELIISNERNEPNINSPFNFNRIITPYNYKNKIINLLGVKYILSLNKIKNSSLKKVFQEGSTIVYENKNYLPRAFFVLRTFNVKNNQDAINKIFNSSFYLFDMVTVSNFFNLNYSLGKAIIVKYEADRVFIKTENKNKGFLVLTDSFYPTWKAFVDNKETKIYKTDFNFRGILVPKGKHLIVFKDNLF